MERQQIAGNETVSSRSSLSKPRFDDEATLLSARPVVPLHELAGTAGQRRRLVVALAITAALLIGVLGGAFYASLGEQVQTQNQQANESPSRPPSQDRLVTTSTEGEEAVLEEPKLVVVEKGDNSTSNPGRRTDDSVVHGSPATRGMISGARASVGRLERDAFADLEDERDVRRTERRRARRLRHAARENAEPSDDLLRIREIFEGPPRP